VKRSTTGGINALYETLPTSSSAARWMRWGGRFFLFVPLVAEYCHQRLCTFIPFGEFKNNT